MSEIILRSDGLTKRYGQYNVVENVSLTINKGDIYGFVGRNGAGKTTFMRMIGGLIDANGGSFRLLGARSDDAKALQKARSKVCSMIEAPALHMNLSAHKNLELQCLLFGQPKNKIWELMDLVGISDAPINRPVKNFSLGMKQRVGIAMAMVSDPEFMLLDEPTNGLDPQGIMHIRQILKRLNQERGVTIMISSHILSELKMVATRFGFINNGRLINEISLADLEKKARAATEITVSDCGQALLLLQSMGMNCAISRGKVLVYDEDFDLAKVAVKFSENNIAVYNIQKGQADLERYFMDLISNGNYSNHQYDNYQGGGNIPPFIGGGNNIDPFAPNDDNNFNGGAQ